MYWADNRTLVNENGSSRNVNALGYEMPSENISLSVITFLDPGNNFCLDTVNAS